jgi:uncharacterized membrane protein SpoIIM required for sporulation
MSSFTGLQGEPWSLRRAVDALAQAARAAGRPGLIWIAGLGYPAVGAGLGMGLGVGSLSGGNLSLRLGDGGIANAGMGGDDFISMLLTLGFFIGLPLVMAFLRLRVGLARIAPPEIWQRLSDTFGRVRLRQAWRAGKGLTRPTLALSILVWLMLAVVVLALGIPTALLVGLSGAALGDAGSTLMAIALALPAVALVATQALLLSVILQLALMSLAHNRRGVSSALVHAWRIARHDPWATGRTLAVDLMLNVTVFTIAVIATGALRLLQLDSLAVIAVQLPLIGFLGVTRAGYWARAYRALGGLSPDDRVPGLRESAPSWSH